MSERPKPKMWTKPGAPKNPPAEVAKEIEVKKLIHEHRDTITSLRELLKKQED